MCGSEDDAKQALEDIEKAEEEAANKAWEKWEPCFTEVGFGGYAIDMSDIEAGVIGVLGSALHRHLKQKRREREREEKRLEQINRGNATKTLQLTAKEVYAVRELVHVTSTSYGRVVSTERCLEAMGMTEEQTNVLYGKLCEADDGPED